MNPTKADEYLTVAGIAGELKLNQQTIRNMIDRGQLRAVRVGTRRVRVLRSDLDDLLAGGATAPAADDETQADPLGRYAVGRTPPCKARAMPSRPAARATSPPP